MGIKIMLLSTMLLSKFVEKHFEIIKRIFENIFETVFPSKHVRKFFIILKQNNNK